MALNRDKVPLSMPVMFGVLVFQPALPFHKRRRTRSLFFQVIFYNDQELSGSLDFLYGSDESGLDSLPSSVDSVRAGLEAMSGSCSDVPVGGKDAMPCQTQQSLKNVARHR